MNTGSNSIIYTVSQKTTLLLLQVQVQIQIHIQSIVNPVYLYPGFFITVGHKSTTTAAAAAAAAAAAVVFVTY